MLLTKREKELINTIVNKQCFTYEAIAKNLNIEVATVSTHLLNIYLKKELPLNSIAALVWDYYNGRDRK